MPVIDLFRGPHGFLSNFAPSPVALDGDRLAPTVEHGFQAAKAVHWSDYDRILRADTPSAAKRLGRSIALRADWDAVKLGVMRHLLVRKFDVGTPLAAQLLATGDALLIESNTWGDTYWGMVGGTGDNWLGHLLMARRAELRGYTA